MGAKLREVRRRIRSVQSTMKITRAMELIATSRIMRAQQRVERAVTHKFAGHCPAAGFVTRIRPFGIFLANQVDVSHTGAGIVFVTEINDVRYQGGHRGQLCFAFGP